MRTRTILTLLLPLLLFAACMPVPGVPPSAPTSAAAQPGVTKLTARMLTQPDALVGPYPSSFSWSPVGATLTYVMSQDPSGGDVLWLYDATTGDATVLLDPAQSPGAIDVTSAQWSPDGTRLLLAGDESLWLLDLATGELAALPVGGGDTTGFMFTPDGSHVSYVQDNDLYLMEIDDGAIQRLTTDGGETVFNGALDWVYNEELATRTAQPAYAWSPDSAWLIYLRLDETAVNNDPVTDYRPVPATVSTTRYPAVGTTNPAATLHALTPGALAPPLEVPLPDDAEYVLPYFTWTPDSHHAIFTTVNRDHTRLALSRWTPQSGELRTLITETAVDWINEDRTVAPIFLGDGEQFLWLSERDGFMHLYLHAQDGTLLKQLTQGEWMIDSSGFNLLTPGRPVHVDPEGASAYFLSTKDSPLERQLYRLDIASGDLKRLSEEPGFHALALAADGSTLVDQFSDVDTPPITKLVKTGDGSATVLSEAAGPALDLPDVTREFVTVKAHDGTDLIAQLVTPADFDPARKYPVVVHWYGGPTLQMVSNRYGTTNIFNLIERDVLYTQEGMLVWRLDNRGTFGRGHAFESPIFGELGKVALEDQLAGIEYLKTLPYVDTARIGTDGKSFGGYMTLYALLHAPDVFRCGVAGAPPTDWSTYDTIYTERYMRTPEKNPDGYAATNLISLADRLQARPLLIHGLADTNVHLQNTVNFIQALEANDKLFNFIPLPNLSHSFHGDGLVAALAASADYLAGCLAGPAPSKQQPAAEPVPATPAPEATAAVTGSMAAAVTPAETAAAAPLPDGSQAITTTGTSAQPVWQVETLLVAPGEPGRLYALVQDGLGPLWAFPASGVRLMISDDFAVTWAPFPGGLPVAAACMVNVNLDYATADSLYASTCQGLYVWDPQGQAWAKRSDQLTNVVAVGFGDPETVWAAAPDDGVIRSGDGGRTWQDASAGLTTFGGMANLGIDPRDNSTLYGIIQPKYAGSYLRRGTADGVWQTMAAPADDAAIATGMAIDGNTGALFVTTQTQPAELWRSSNPATADVADVQWELVHDFGSDAQVSLLASGWSPQGLAIYANIWPLTPLAGGGASVGAPVLYRSPDGGQTWTPLATP